MLEIGSVVDGKYKILGEIGRGGMSVVYLALNERLNKTWAIKEIRKESIMAFDRAGHNLLPEIHILKELHHRCLPSIVDMIDDGDGLLIVMDYIQGQSLKALMIENMNKKGIALPLQDVLSWGRQLCDVLNYLHTRSEPIIYRDLKPSNVMVRPDGEISLIDFGTARVFKEDHGGDTICLGTPGYAAPEQYGGNGQTGPQTDIYCLGATLHYLMTGRDPSPTPFYFPKITECRPELFEETPIELRDALLGLEVIIDRCTQYNMAERYPSCVDLQYDLDHPERLGVPCKCKIKKKWRTFVICVVMSFICLGLSLIGFVMEHSVREEGYDVYIEWAETAEDQDRMALYKKAAALNPWQSDAYLKLLDMMLEDNLFSADEEGIMIQLLTTKDGGRRKDNRTCFQENKCGYVVFSYQMGLAYYYLAGGKGDKSRAAGWFQNVVDADMEKLDFGADNVYKAAWQARARILGRISSYYQYRLGQVNQMGDMEVSYRDYWEDLMLLMDEEVAKADNVITELRLYYEIAVQIYDRTMTFKNEAGLEQAELEGVLDELEGRIKKIDTAGASLADELIDDINRMIDNARRNICVAYGSEGDDGKNRD